MERYDLIWSSNDHIHEDCLTGVSLENGILILERDHNEEAGQMTHVPIGQIQKVRIHTGKIPGRGNVRILAVTYIDGHEKTIHCHIPSKKDPRLNAFIKKVTQASAIEIEDGDMDLYRYVLMIIAGLIIVVGMVVMIQFSMG